MIPMKNLRAFILPAVAAGVASLIVPSLASADNVFVVNNGSNTVSEISNGAVSTFTATDLNSPTGIAINSAGDVFVANNGSSSGSGYIEEYSPTGTPIEQYYSGLNNPRGITFDSSGNLYVAVQGSQQFIEIPVGGGTDTVLASGFSAPNGVAFDSNTLYASDGGSGNTIDTISNGSSSTVISALSSPNGLAFDSAGNLFVVQHGTNAITEFLAGSTVGTTFIQQTSAQGPKAIAIDSTGDFFITDNTSGTVTEYSKAGALLDTFTNPNFSGPCYITTELAVPEPTTYALIFAGMGALYFMRRKKAIEATI